MGLDEIRRWMEGIRKAKVLPVPVLAWARRSCSDKMVGRVAACTFWDGFGCQSI